MELKNYFHEGISFALEKLDVVTRQEFDVQTELLSRTRHKLEILEQKLAGLEQRLMFNSPESHKK